MTIHQTSGFVYAWIKEPPPPLFRSTPPPPPQQPKRKPSPPFLLYSAPPPPPPQQPKRENPKSSSHPQSPMKSLNPIVSFDRLVPSPKIPKSRSIVPSKIPKSVSFFALNSRLSVSSCWSLWSRRLSGLSVSSRWSPSSALNSLSLWSLRLLLGHGSPFSYWCYVGIRGWCVVFTNFKRWPYKTSLRLIHARMHAQALNLAVLSGASMMHFYEKNKTGEEANNFGCSVSLELKVDLLILLSDVEGLYSGPPSDPQSKLIDTYIKEKHQGEITFGGKSRVGRGEMELTWMKLLVFMACLSFPLMVEYRDRHYKFDVSHSSSTLALSAMMLIIRDGNKNYVSDSVANQKRNQRRNASVSDSAFRL
ncbi:hypothetical protein Syun_008587 [Stephania yunnanensis]|uniref:HIG1 domain-containing protein n=1 Tax=Stephania yunnanensis TaxID=152371 RepID=A0AAP0PMQ2_9MAGN